METRRCSLCRKKLAASDAIISSLKSFCSVEHLAEYAKTDRAKRYAGQAKKKEVKKAKEKLKTLSDWRKEAQTAFNYYIRVRDQDKPCVSCGASQGVVVRGGAFDAGHYRSRGSAPHLAFHTQNCHAQCVKCNRHLSGNIVEYRKRLIERIGLERVEQVEHDDRLRKYNCLDYKRIIKLSRKGIKRCQKKQ